MQQNWNIRSRAHECARTARPFAEGEVFYTAIYFDPQSGDFMRRDVCTDAWAEETAERTPLASWKTEYVKPTSGPAKPEITTKESPESLLRRLIDEDQEHTEHARYILTLMLERKKLLAPKETKYTESGIMQIYEHRKTGEVFIIRDPELRLDEIEAVQEEVAMLLGFAGPGGAAAAQTPASAQAEAPVAEASGGVEATGEVEVQPAEEEVKAESEEAKTEEAAA